jgi:hypothetical protein
LCLTGAEFCVTLSVVIDCCTKHETHFGRETDLPEPLDRIAIPDERRASWIRICMTIGPDASHIATKIAEMKHNCTLHELRLTINAARSIVANLDGKAEPEGEQLIFARTLLAELELEAAQHDM